MQKATYFPTNCKSKTAVKKKKNERNTLHLLGYLFGNKGVGIHTHTHTHVHTYLLIFSKNNGRVNQKLIKRNSKLREEDKREVVGRTKIKTRYFLMCLVL